MFSDLWPSEFGLHHRGLSESAVTRERPKKGSQQEPWRSWRTGWEERIKRRIETQDFLLNREMLMSNKLWWSLLLQQRSHSKIRCLPYSRPDYRFKPQENRIFHWNPFKNANIWSTLLSIYILFWLYFMTILTYNINVAFLEVSKSCINFFSLKKV